MPEAPERNTRIKYNQIASVRPNDIDAINSALDGQVPSYDSATGKFNWVDASKDFVWQDPVESEGQIDPDLLEDFSGKRFIIGIGAVHSWEGHDQEVATSLSDKTHWSFVSPELGMIAYVCQENKFYHFNGVAWVTEAESLSSIQDTDGTTKIEAFSEYLKFTTDGSERMRIISTGKVGIGLDSPLEALQVVGNIRLSGTITDGTNAATPADIASAVSLKHSNSLDHSRQHSITSTSDHTSSATSGYLLKADASGLPITATNTDSDVSDTVSKKHSNSLDHTQGTDQGLDTGGANATTAAAVKSAVTLKHSNSLDHTQNTDIKIITGNTEVLTTDTGSDGKIEVKPEGTVQATFNASGLTLNTGAAINEFSIDGTMGGNSDLAVPTEKAVKTYADTKKFGAWVDASAACTDVLAATDGFVVAMTQLTSGGNDGAVQGYTDANSTPTTKRAESEMKGIAYGAISIMFPVKKGDYWRVAFVNTNAGSNKAYWIPLGN